MGGFCGLYLRHVVFDLYIRWIHVTFGFVLFRQLGRETVYAPGWRQNFNTKEFAELYNLGLPVAAVYFNIQRESGSGGRRLY